MRLRQTSGIYNLGSGQARSFNELVRFLNQSLGTIFTRSTVENPHAHYQNFTQADLTNSRKALGYEPQFSLEEACRLHEVPLWVAHASRVLARASRDRGILRRATYRLRSIVLKRLFRRDAETNTRDACATLPRKNLVGPTDFRREALVDGTIERGLLKDFPLRMIGREWDVNF